jgi:hypothetical protein
MMRIMLSMLIIRDPGIPAKSCPGKKLQKWAIFHS